MKTTKSSFKYGIFVLIAESIINIFRGLKKSGQSYLLPFVVILLIMALLLLGLHVVSPLAPFVYSLF